MPCPAIDYQFRAVAFSEHPDDYRVYIDGERVSWPWHYDPTWANPLTRFARHLEEIWMLSYYHTARVIDAAGWPICDHTQSRLPGEFDDFGGSRSSITGESVDQRRWVLVTEEPYDRAFRDIFGPARALTKNKIGGFRLEGVPVVFENRPSTIGASTDTYWDTWFWVPGYGCIELAVLTFRGGWFPDPNLENPVYVQGLLVVHPGDSPEDGCLRMPESSRTLIPPTLTEGTLTPDGRGFGSCSGRSPCADYSEFVCPPPEPIEICPIHFQDKTQPRWPSVAPAVVTYPVPDGPDRDDARLPTPSQLADLVSAAEDAATEHRADLGRSVFGLVKFLNEIARRLYAYGGVAWLDWSMGKDWTTVTGDPNAQSARVHHMQQVAITFRGLSPEPIRRPLGALIREVVYRWAPSGDWVWQAPPLSGDVYDYAIPVPPLSGESWRVVTMRDTTEPERAAAGGFAADRYGQVDSIFDHLAAEPEGYVYRIYHHFSELYGSRSPGPAVETGAGPSITWQNGARVAGHLPPPEPEPEPEDPMPDYTLPVSQPCAAIPAAVVSRWPEARDIAATYWDEALDLGGDTFWARLDQALFQYAGGSPSVSAGASSCAAAAGADPAHGSYAWAASYTYATGADWLGSLPTLTDTEPPPPDPDPTDPCEGLIDPAECQPWSQVQCYQTYPPDPDQLCPQSGYVDPADCPSGVCEDGQVVIGSDVVQIPPGGTVVVDPDDICTCEDYPCPRPGCDCPACNPPPCDPCPPCETGAGDPSDALSRTAFREAGWVPTDPDEMIVTDIQRIATAAASVGYDPGIVPGGSPVPGVSAQAFPWLLLGGAALVALSRR